MSTQKNNKAIIFNSLLTLIGGNGDRDSYLVMT